VADFFKASDALEAEPLVEADRALVGGVHGADHHVLVESGRQGK
jgi:hypothetical protein